MNIFRKFLSSIKSLHNNYYNSMFDDSILNKDLCYVGLLTDYIVKFNINKTEFRVILDRSFSNSLYEIRSKDTQCLVYHNKDRDEWKVVLKDDCFSVKEVLMVVYSNNN